MALPSAPGAAFAIAADRNADPLPAPQSGDSRNSGKGVVPELLHPVMLAAKTARATRLRTRLRRRTRRRTRSARPHFRCVLCQA